MRRRIILLLLLTIIFAACGGKVDTSSIPTPTKPDAIAPSGQLPSPTPPLESEGDRDTDEPEDEQDAPLEAQDEQEVPDDGNDESSENEAENEAPAPGPTPTSTKASPAGPEEVIIEAADGLALAGTYYPGLGPGPSPGLLLLHMNGGSQEDWSEIASELWKGGYSVLTLDMRGHGQTGGAKDWEQAAGDLERVWSYFVDRQEVDVGRTAIIGASIGANMALLTAGSMPAISGVVLLSPGLDYFGVTTDDAILDYGSRPLMIAASEEDSYAAESSRTLADLAEGEAELVMLNGAGHGTRMFSAQPELIDQLREWLERHIRSPLAKNNTRAEISQNDRIFNMGWENRSFFRGGLTKVDASILDGLDGASVYHLALDFSADMTSLDGNLQLRYTNQESSALDDLFFHLYPNRLGGQLTVSQVNVKSLTVVPNYYSSESVMGIPLQEPLEPGESLEVDMVFSLTVPGNQGANFGLLAAFDNILALAHFYPQMAVYDDTGWNIEIPAGIPDLTYADSAFYLVHVSAPADRVVTASGMLLEQTIDDRRQELTFAAGPVRDFYLTGGDDFIFQSQKVGETVVNSYGSADDSLAINTALGFAVDALEIFNRRIGPYPFTELDVVAMPTLENGLALGIEYPGIVVINSELYESGGLIGRSKIPAGVLLEATVAHEVGHQWFYSTVGNDQVDEPWLDESLVQFITYQYYRDKYGEDGAEGFNQALLSRWGQVQFENIPIGLSTGDYSPQAYSAIVYGRGPLFFKALSEHMGEKNFEIFLSDYYMQNKWGTATGESLKDLAEKHCACDLSQLFAEWVIET